MNSLPSLRVLALALTSSACVTNSPGEFRGVPLDGSSPVVRLQACARDPHWDGTFELAALWHLEDLVEESGSRLYGRQVDFATPTLSAPVGMIELIDRAAVKPEEGVLSGSFGPAFFGLDPLGLKYLLDHFGLAFPEIENVSAARAICEAVGSYLDESTTKDETLRAIREAESVLCKDLELTEEDLAATARRYDAATGMLYGHTRMEGSRPHITLCLPTVMLETHDMVLVYAHEMMHCILASDHPAGAARAFQDPRSTEFQALNELACETFASLVVADLAERGLLPADAEQRVSVGIPPAEQRDRNRQSLVRRLDRLRELYHVPEVTFVATQQLAERYGAVASENDPGRISELMASCIRSMGVREFARRFWSLTDYDDLARLQRECTREPGLSDSPIVASLSAGE